MIASLRPRTSRPGFLPRVPSRTRSVGSAVGWAAAVTLIEAIAKRRMSSRSRAWLVAYSVIGAAAGAEVLAGQGVDQRNPGAKQGRADLVAGLALAAGGYQVGRLLLRDRPSIPPPEAMWLETLAVAGVVAPAEEVAWGALVQPALGITATSGLFAAKHVAVDGRWRRSLGLALFGVGLGLLRRRSPKLALVVHVGCNAAGVALGHLTGRDQF